MMTGKARGSYVFSKIFYLYYDGFKAMTLGKTLWIIILVKLFIFFFVLKLFFFPDLLNTRFDTDDERAEHVSVELTNPYVK